MASKKFMAFLLTLAMVFSLTACGKKSEEETKKKKTKKTTKQEETYEYPDDPEDTEDPEDITIETDDPDVTAFDDQVSLDFTTITPGCIYVLPETYDAFRGLFLSSPSSGTSGMNNGGYRSANIRYLFQLDDHIEIYPELASENQAVYLIPHHEDLSIYTEDYISGLSDEIARAEFIDPNDPAWYWADICPVESVYEPGYYDLVITDQGTPVILICLKLVDHDALDNVNDYDYYSMLKKEMDRTGASEQYKIDFDRFYGCYEQGIWPDDFTWSGSGLPTLPSVSPSADIEMDVLNTTFVKITSPLENVDGEDACTAIDEVFQNNGYLIEYPEGDADANYRYVHTDIDGVPAEISYYSYNGNLILTIENMVANAYD